MATQQLSLPTDEGKAHVKNGLLSIEKSATLGKGHKKEVMMLGAVPCMLPSDQKAILMRQLEKDPVSKGRTQYRRFLNGEALTCQQAILAKCYDCDGGHNDGKVDCEVNSCPLRPFMPFSAVERVKRVMTEEQMEAARANMRILNEKKKSTDNYRAPAAKKGISDHPAEVLS